MKIKPIAFSFVVSLAISFIFLLITFWIFYKYSWSVEAAKEALSTTGSYFGAIATLGAACIAAYLFNDWRVERNFDLENHYLTNIIFGLRNIHAELLEMQFNSKQINKAPNKIISYAFYLNRSRFDIKSALNKLDADVLIYSRLLNNKELLVFLEHLKGYCNSFDNQYNQLIHKYYRDYLNKLNDYFSTIEIVDTDYKNKTSFERIYVNDERKFLSKEIKAIKIFFYLNKSCVVNGEKVQINFLELADRSVEAVDGIQDACISKLRPKI